MNGTLTPCLKTFFEFLKPGARNANETNLVAPTGFEPVFQSRHVFAYSYGNLRYALPVELARDSNTHGVPLLGGRPGLEDRAAV
jgi:hypothetical protein